MERLLWSDFRDGLLLGLGGEVKLATFKKRLSTKEKGFGGDFMSGSYGWRLMASWAQVLIGVGDIFR